MIINLSGVMHQIKQLADPDIPLGVGAPKGQSTTGLPPVTIKQEPVCSPQPGPSSLQSSSSQPVVSSSGASSPNGSIVQLGKILIFNSFKVYFFYLEWIFSSLHATGCVFHSDYMPYDPRHLPLFNLFC